MVAATRLRAGQTHVMRVVYVQPADDDCLRRVATILAGRGSAQLGVTFLPLRRPQQCLPSAVAAGALGRGRHPASLAAFGTSTASAASDVATGLSVSTAALAIAATTIAAAALAATALAAAALAAATATDHNL